MLKVFDGGLVTGCYRVIFPNACKQARIYLAISATSVSSERRFSKAGLIISDRDLRLQRLHK